MHTHHPHDHPHGHDAGHRHDAEHRDAEHRHDAVPRHTLAPSQTGSVMLDIGGDIGALVLYVAATEHGREIEVSPVGGGIRTHAAVRARHLDHTTVHCVVIPGLVAGEYTVWAAPTVPAGTVTVTGGQITEVDWSDGSPTTGAPA